MPKPIEIKSFKLDELINFVEKNDICIPEFQRGYVWKAKQVRDLFDSLIQKYPIGSFIIWRTNQKIGKRDIFASKQKKIRDKFLILDGQQRILSIYYLCKQAQFLEIEDSFEMICENTGKNIINFQHFYFEKKLKLELKYSKDEFCSFNFEEFKRRLGNYLFPVIIVTVNEYSKAIKIFERINQSGTRIGTEAIFLSEAWNKDTNLGQILRKWKHDHQNTLTGSVDSIIYIHTLIIIIQLEEKVENVDISLRTLKNIAEKIKNEKGKEYEKKLKEVLNATSEALSFLAKEYEIKKINELPSQTLVTILSVFFYYCNSPTRGQRTELKKWFWRSSLSSRYVGSGYNENITKDVVRMKDLAKKREKLNIPRHELYLEDFQDTDIRTGRSTLRNAVKLMLWNKTPQWINGARINPEESESIKNKKENDHFYPYDFYRKGILDGNVNNILNLCFLPKKENGKKTNDLPSKWLSIRQKELSSSDDDANQFFKSNLLPFNSIADLRNKEFDLETNRGKIKKKQLKKYYQKFLKRRFEYFEKELNRLQRGQ